MSLSSLLCRWFGIGCARKPATPPPSPAPPSPIAPIPPRPARLALNVHDAADERVVSWAASCGCAWARTTYYVHAAALDAGYRPRFLAGLAALDRAGMRALVVVHSLGPDEYGDELPDALIALVAAVAETPGARLDALQIGNELNDANRWTPFLRAANQYARGAEYARLYERCRRALATLGGPLERFAATPIVVAGLVGNGGEFLRGMLDAGVTPDRSAVHVYGLPLSGDALRAAVAASRLVFPTVPVWITEVGSEGGRELANHAGDAQQERDMRAALDALGAPPLDDVLAFWYCAAGDWPNALTALVRSPGDAELRLVERPAGTSYRLAAKR